MLQLLFFSRWWCFFHISVNALLVLVPLLITCWCFYFSHVGGATHCAFVLLPFPHWCCCSCHLHVLLPLSHYANVLVALAMLLFPFDPSTIVSWCCHSSNIVLLLFLHLCLSTYQPNPCCCSLCIDVQAHTGPTFIVVPLTLVLLFFSHWFHYYFLGWFGTFPLLPYASWSLEHC